MVVTLNTFVDLGHSPCQAGSKPKPIWFGLLSFTVASEEKRMNPTVGRCGCHGSRADCTIHCGLFECTPSGVRPHAFTSSGADCHHFATPTPGLGFSALGVYQLCLRSRSTWMQHLALLSLAVCDQKIQRPGSLLKPKDGLFQQQRWNIDRKRVLNPCPSLLPKGLPSPDESLGQAWLFQMSYQVLGGQLCPHKHLLSLLREGSL